MNIGSVEGACLSVCAMGVTNLNQEFSCYGYLQGRPIFGPCEGAFEGY